MCLDVFNKSVRECLIPVGLDGLPLQLNVQPLNFLSTQTNTTQGHHRWDKATQLRAHATSGYLTFTYTTVQALLMYSAFPWCILSTNITDNYVYMPDEFLAVRGQVELAQEVGISSLRELKDFIIVMASDIAILQSH